MRGFLRDWQRWSKAERVAALCLGTTFLSGVPTLFFVTVLRATQ